MRASRAYIAGFGTAGSLLAGAAMVFVLASAVVAFRGWPQVGWPATPVAIVAAQPRGQLDVRAVRKLLAADAAVASTAVTTSAPARGAAGTASAPPVSMHLAAPTSPAPTDQQTTHGYVPTKQTGTPPVCSAACRPPAQTVSGTVNHATGVLGGTVSAAGNAVASTLTSLTANLAKTLSGLSPGLGKTVKQAGDALGGTLSGATGAVGGLLSGTGQTLAQLLGAHH